VDRLDHVKSDANSMSRRDFILEHRSPILLARVIKGGTLERKKAPQVDTENESKSGFAKTQPIAVGEGTMHLVKPAELENLGDGFTDPSILLDRKLENERYVSLELSPTSPKNAPIKLGRSTASDVVVNDYTVSKDHAWFAAQYFPDRAPRYILMDRGSTNGTFVRGVRVPSNSRVLVDSGDKVVLGRMAFVFLSIGDFYEYLRGVLTNQHAIEALLEEDVEDEG